MKRSFLICALFLGACVSQPVLSRGQTTSPIGTWQVDILGSEKGILMMTFSNNFTVTGYGIARKQSGFITLAGTWHFDDKGDVLAGYVQTTNGVGMAAFSLTAHMLSPGRFRGKATSSSSRGYRCKGEQPLGFPPLSGSWNAVIKRKGKTLHEEFTATASSNYPAVFDITGQGLSDTTSFTLSGTIIVSAENKVNASIDRTFGTDVQQSSLSGVFKPTRSKMLLDGDDDTGAHLSETATR
ncbi:MAG: hypothetical protein ABSA12_06865 [Verrucomicrobiia bacterium]